MHANLNYENIKTNTTRTATLNVRNTVHIAKWALISTGRKLEHSDSHPRSCLKWIPTGRVFKRVGYRRQPVKKHQAPTTTSLEKFNPLGVNSKLSNCVEPLY